MSTCQRRIIRSTESYAFCRPMNHRNSDTHTFLSNFCALRTANVISVVERCGWNPHCSSGNRFFASQEVLSLVATTLKRTLPACTMSEMPRWFPHSVLSFFFCKTFAPALRHRCGTFRSRVGNQFAECEQQQQRQQQQSMYNGNRLYEPCLR